MFRSKKKYQNKNQNYLLIVLNEDKKRVMNLLRKHTIKYILLILLSVYLVSISLFPHSHIINGRRITHSHIYDPFDAQKKTDHQHSQNEILLIDMLSHFIAAVFFISFSLKILKNFTDRISSVRMYELLLNLLIFNSVSLRAPPTKIS